ncbi:hypothetical protein LguiB_021782 [Lonicera macranthoides]
MKVVILLPQQWCVLLLFLLPAAAAAAPPPPPPPPPLFSISKPGCRDKCGNESVPFPFGFGRSECFKSSLFMLNCTCDDKGKNCKLLKGDFEVVNISMETGTATFYTTMLHSCYNQSGRPSYSFWLGTNKSAFTFSSKQNKFTALGCDTNAMIVDPHRKRPLTGCFSACYNKVNLADEDGGGDCSGRGCCRTQVPKGLKFLYISLKTVFKYARDFSPCTYAFLANQDWNGFTSISLTDTLNVNHKSPMVVDWVVGKKTCKNFCRLNSICNKSQNGPGYLCSCQNGYQGNPYLGCQDIDECKDPKTHNCEGTCKNTNGSFTCHCPPGTYLTDKGACKGFRLTTLAGVIGVCVSLVVVIFFLWMECKRCNKARNFSKNGGTLLKNHEIVIYKEKELKKATKKYDPDQLLGRGGSGSVYKGELFNRELQHEELVAIKIPNVDPDIARGGIRQYFRSREKSNNDFLNEIKMICSVNHKYVVKLKGLCLETNIPLLVYEYVPNKSLYHHIHNEKSAELNLWKDRLRIAYDTAEALNYLHSKAGDTSIIHGDVKSKNILLDKNFTPKVVDFGASVLVPLKQNSFSVTKLQGTRGYLDPEYESTGRLTVKSDVYSFGVVLMELLTSQKPISKKRSLVKVNYIPYFVLSVEEKKFGEVIDYGRLGDNDQKMKLQVEAVAKLAVKCLNRSSLGRPDMAEVEHTLRNSGVIVSVDCSDNISMPSCSSYTETQYMTASDEIQLNPSS